MHVPTSIVEFHLTWIWIDQRFILLPEKIPETTSGQKVSTGNTNKTYILTNSGIGALIYKKSIHFTKRSLILLHFFGFRFHWFDWRFFCDYFDTKVFFPFHDFVLHGNLWHFIHCLLKHNFCYASLQLINFINWS